MKPCGEEGPKYCVMDGLTKHQELATGTAQDQPPACEYLKKTPLKRKGKMHCQNNRCLGSEKEYLAKELLDH